MTPKEAFKIGFLEKCAADGCSPKETLQRINHATAIVKSADWVSSLKSMVAPLIGGGAGIAGERALGGSGLAGGVAGASAGTLAADWKTMLPYLLFAPPAAGLGGGYALSQMQDDTYDADEAKKREEVAEYNRAIERLRKLQARQQAV